MSESLVTRDSEIQHGRPCLRGTRFPVASLQSILDVGGMPYLRNQFSSLDGWPDEDLERAATYPRLPDTIGIGGLPALDWYIDLSDDGSFQVAGVFMPGHAPAIISAIQQAADTITAWRTACDVWERRQADRTAVAAALEAAQIKRFVAMDWTVDASRNALVDAFVTTFDDRATLAAEVERLRRLHEARPPYEMAQWTPADLAELLERDTAISQTMVNATRDNITGCDALADGARVEGVA